MSSGVKSRRDLFWPVFTALLALALGALLWDVGGTAIQLGRFAGSLKWRLAVLGGGALLLCALSLFALSWTPAFTRIQARLEAFQAWLGRLGGLNLLVPLLLGGLYILLVYFPPRQIFDDPSVFSGLWARLGLVFFLGLVSAPWLRAAFARLNPAENAALGGAEAAALGVLLFGVLHQILTFVPQVSASPFTLGWSEASRFYYGSLFQSAAVYGQAQPLPFLHPSRYVLLSLPYLLPGLPLWFHRLWQVFLWLGLTGLNAWLLVRRVRRLGLKSATAGWIGTAWAFLFLFQGPVYYHLLVCTALVLGGFDRRRLGRSLAVIVLASLWAGISRVNWLPMPACLALALYFLETPLGLHPQAGGWKQLKNYLLPGAIWSAVGLAAAYAANRLYILLSGQPDPSVFKSSFSQDLLWYRLWPSPTYPPGILPMTLLLSLPLLALILINLRRAGLGILRLFGLAAMTAVMLAGGLVVSTKIGGGSNLHNLDAYLVLLLVWGGYLLAGAAQPESGSERARRPWLLVILTLAFPLVQLLQGGQPVYFPDPAQDRAVLAQLKSDVEQAARGGPVLFIWQRQLLTFHEINGIKLIPEYETVDLMEMAMADNPAYLGRFYSDLASHRFALIVVDQQNGLVKTAADTFPEENNVWVERITGPLLAHYRVRENFPNGIQLLEPEP